MSRVRRSFNGRVLLSNLNLTIRQEILEDLPNHQSGITAWALARRIDALGSSVSSLLHKLFTRGEVCRLDPRTPHGGRVYKANRND